MTTLRIGMAVDADIVGWIEEGCVNLRVCAHDSLEELAVAPVPAKHTRFVERQESGDVDDNPLE